VGGFYPFQTQLGEFEDGHGEVVCEVNQSSYRAKLRSKVKVYTTAGRPSRTCFRVPHGPRSRNGIMAGLAAQGKSAINRQVNCSRQHRWRR
jgi:hypothetical protein